jgi:hypothetical protein
MAPFGQFQQVLLAGALGRLREQLPVQGDPGRLAVDVPQVGEQEQAGFRPAAEQVRRRLLDLLQDAGFAVRFRVGSSP